jgi:hypothetical protein
MCHDVSTKTTAKEADPHPVPYDEIPTIHRCRTGVDLLEGPLVACANQCMNTTSPQATVYSCDFGAMCEVLALSNMCIQEVLCELFFCFCDLSRRSQGIKKAPQNCIKLSFCIDTYYFAEKSEESYQNIKILKKWKFFWKNLREMEKTS